jgi:ferrous iron transport protein B
LEDGHRHFGVLCGARSFCQHHVHCLQPVANPDEEARNTKELQKVSQAQKNPMASGLYPAPAIALMVFYVLALQCVSTVAVVRRETNSWKWPIFQWVYMGVLAWVLAFVTYQGGRLLGFK